MKVKVEFEIDGLFCTSCPFDGDVSCLLQDHEAGGTIEYCTRSAQVAGCPLEVIEGDQSTKDIKIVYIAGPITGIPNYKENFNRAEEALKAKGYIVLNPAIFPEGMAWQQYMDICIPMLEVADAVYFLKRWTNSVGASTEHVKARQLGKQLFFEGFKELKDKGAK